MPVTTGVTIWVWPHFSFSQRATCPPSAVVRQFSIADITLSWPRLTWPALAWRHAGPWPRKISATSGAGRDIAADGYAGNGSFFFFPDFLRGCDSRSSGLSMRYRSRRGRARRKALGSDSMTPFRWRRAVHKIPAWSFRGAAKRRARNDQQFRRLTPDETSRTGGARRESNA